MKIYRTTFIVCLLGGLIILFIGIYLQITGYYSVCNIRQGGKAFLGVINGYSEIFLGIVVLFFSIGAFKLYKKKEKEFRKMR
jgi:Na+/alanine symporter